MAAISDLPPPPPENPTAELLRLVTGFNAELTKYVQAVDGYESLVQQCRPAYNQFKKGILSTRPNFRPGEINQSIDGGDAFSEPEIVVEDVQMEPNVPPGRSPMYLNQVKELIDR